VCINTLSHDEKLRYSPVHVALVRNVVTDAAVNQCLTSVMDCGELRLNFANATVEFHAHAYGDSASLQTPLIAPKHLLAVATRVIEGTTMTRLNGGSEH
jgi:hypothetical protein